MTFPVRSRSIAWVILVAVVVVTGCHSPSDDSDELAALEQPRGVSGFVAVMPGRHTRESDVWEQIAQIEAGKSHRPMSVERPKAGAPASRQAELIRSAAGQGTAVLLVEPEDPRAIAPALEEVRDAGQKILLLDRPVAVRGKPLPLVEYAPIAAPIKTMVTETLKVARLYGAPAHGPAQILVTSGLIDARAKAHLATLKAALAEAGVTVLPDAVVPPETEPQVTFKAALKAKPRPNLVFASEDFLLTNICRIWDEVEEGKLPVLGGFIADRSNARVISYGGCVAIVDLNFNGLAEAAMTTALALARGESVPDRVTVPIEVRVCDLSKKRPPMMMRPLAPAQDAPGR